MPKTTAAAATCVAALLLAATAVAQTPQPRVVVFPVVPLAGEVEQRLADKMTAAVQEEFGNNRGFASLLLDDAAAGLERGAAENARETGGPEVAKAIAELKDGEKLVKKLRLPAAIKKLRHGLQGLEANLAAVRDYELLVKAHLLLSVAYFRRGKQTAGTHQLEQLARLRPGLSLDPGEYPPVFISAWEEAQSRVLGGELGVLNLSSAPAAAQVEVNGIPAGKTPLRLEAVAAGTNHVVMHFKGKSWGKAVAVSPGGVARVHADLGAGGADTPGTIAEAVASNRFDPMVRRMAIERAKTEKGSFVVLLAIGSGKGVLRVAGFIGRVSDGAWTALDTVSPDVDMLSASIEAYTLARDVANRVTKLNPTIDDEIVGFIESKAVGTGERGAGPAPKSVRLLGGLVSLPGGRSPAVAGGRQPVVAGVRRPVSGVEDPPLVAPPGAKRPVAAAQAEEVAAKPKLIPSESEIAAVEAQRTGPLSGAGARRVETVDDSGVTGRWWFWTAVAAGAAVVGTGVALTVHFATQPRGATVVAVWK